MKRLFQFSFGVALNAIKFLVWHKKFGPPQNILEPVEGQGIIVPSSQYTAEFLNVFFIYAGKHCGCFWMMISGT